MSSYVYIWIAYFGDDSEWNGPFKMTFVFELVFTISFMLKFITTYIPEGESIAITDHYLIYTNYRNKGGMGNDIIALTPFVFILDCSKARFFRIVYMIKIIRIFKAFKKVDVMAIMLWIKGIFHK